MTRMQPPDPNIPEGSTRRGFWLWGLAAGCLAVILLAVLLPRQRQTPPATPPPVQKPDVTVDSEIVPHVTAARHLGDAPASSQSAEEIVTHKLARFARHRRQLAHDIARHRNIAVPEEVERFFDAAEAGRFDVTQALYESLKAKRYTDAGTNLIPYMRAIIEAEGAA